MSNNWIMWTGGDNPEGRKLVTVYFRDGRVSCKSAHLYSWHHDGRDAMNDIVKYKFGDCE